MILKIIVWLLGRTALLIQNLPDTFHRHVLERSILVPACRSSLYRMLPPPLLTSPTGEEVELDFGGGQIDQRGIYSFNNAKNTTMPR